MRITNAQLQKLIANEGTSDGSNPVSVTGVLRLALDLQKARAEVKRPQEEITEADYMSAGGPEEHERKTIQKSPTNSRSCT
jgi:hypothetical protein